MKNLLVIAAVLLMFMGLNAQGTSASVDKEVVLEKIDKNTVYRFQQNYFFVELENLISTSKIDFLFS